MAPCDFRTGPDPLLECTCVLFPSCRGPSDALYFYQGSDEPDRGDGKPSYNIIADNTVQDAAEGVKMGDTVGNEFTGNVSLLLCHGGR